MKKFVFSFFLVSLCFMGFRTVPKFHTKKNASTRAFTVSLEEKINTKISFLKANTLLNSKYNTEIAFLIDMKIMSGKNRFFVIDLKNNTILDQGLVTHGLGSETETRDQLKFSNTPNSLCTALGKYVIGKSYVGQFGKAYKLIGLDKTNNNAFQRKIVLHQYDKVPYEEQNYPICQSMGCPMVNTLFYARIQKLIDNSKKNIILEIYY